jgi:glycosyltransferase involved in cell wall biosynthesis
VLEALASGTPVVASRIPPFTEYLNDNDVEWADPMLPESIAAAMARSVIKPTFVPPAVCRRYSWDASAARHAALYRSLVAVPATIY